jgi:hypothetical protein
VSGFGTSTNNTPLCLKMRHGYNPNGSEKSTQLILRLTTNNYRIDFNDDS